LTTLVDLEWLPRERATDEFELPAERFQVVAAVARLPGTEGALAADGTVFVADLAAGLVYRVTFPPSPSMRGRHMGEGFLGDQTRVPRRGTLRRHP
jgi:hypothetical protein